MPRKRTLSPQDHAELATKILPARNRAFAMIVGTLGPALIAKGSKTLPEEVSAASGVVHKLDAIVKLLRDDLQEKHPAAPNCYSNDQFKPPSLRRESSTPLTAEEREAVIDALSACHSSNLTGMLPLVSAAFIRSSPIITTLAELDAAVDKAIRLLRRSPPTPAIEILPPEPAAAVPTGAPGGEIAALYGQPFETLSEPQMIRRNLRSGLIVDNRILSEPVDLDDLKKTRLQQNSAHASQKLAVRVADGVLRARTADRMQELVERLKRGRGDTPSETPADPKEPKK